MKESVRRRLRLLAATVAVASPVASHAALALGQGYGAALSLAAAQALASGLLVSTLFSKRRWLGAVLALSLLAALALGTWSSAASGLLALAGLGHTLLYGTLFAVFATSLQPGRVSLVTGLASRLNPSFHEGMTPYTRGVTMAWCLFFAAQLVVSGVLVAFAPRLWGPFVTTAHAPLVVVMALAEFLVRRWWWRHEHYTSLTDTIRGVARLRAEAAAGRTSRPAEDCL
jgi:uncharacterized membrane protein